MKKNVIWPEFQLDRALQAPTLRLQIERQLRQAIRDGRLACGARLPSSRLLAKLLSVSRGTVVEAYEGLIGAGLIIAVAGSGMRVSHRTPRIPNPGNLMKAAAAAHYPSRVYAFEDQDGTTLYLNVLH
jgi:GntR family transcriptional regulator/MocR family aminotransferase